MVTATSVVHALTAIKEALTVDQTGDASKPHALAASKLFRRGYPRGVDRTLRSREAFVQKTAFVAVADLQPDAMPAQEQSGSHLYRAQFWISCDYHISYEYDPARVDALMVESVDDAMKIAAALCYPGSLLTTLAAAPTGLVGAGALARAGSRSRVAVERVGDEVEGPRLLNVTHTFPGELLFDPT